MQQDNVTIDELRELDADGTVTRLAPLPNPAIARLLHGLGPGRAVAIMDRFGPERRRQIAFAAGQGEDGQWLSGQHWPEGSIGRLMEPPPAVFPPDATVTEVIQTLRPIVSHTLVTYVFVIDGERHLIGLVAFRELAFAQPGQRLADIMIVRPFALRPDTEVIDAMREVVRRHYPVYPVSDADGRLIGIVRGAVLFEEQAFEISAQAGAMVGVEKEERLATPWLRSLRFRNPWLQINLLTTFITATVVGSFQNTINHIVLLAVFLPVLSDQCNNTGSQALAVTLRGLTFGELKPGRGWILLAKEAWLGFLNGALTGLVAALAMLALARYQGHPQAFVLAVITFAALTGSCVLAGIVGAGVPQILKRLGADPATASSIFLTKATDVASLGLFLGLATWLIAG
ncbi:magnesium transporter [Dokdonella soli]|uniref:Magnesium transporter n=1 Tax=Dokdonella soli TaxID=529810 RepID=A0ABP3THS8_9GAMM